MRLVLPLRDSRCLGLLDKVVHITLCSWAPPKPAVFVSHFSSVDLQVVEVVQRGAQSPACLYVVHFLGQLGGGKPNTKSVKCLLYLLK